MRSLVLATIMTAATLAAGCAARVGYTATVATAPPDLVYVSPGVQVIADYDEPIFYSDTFYWRFYGGTWYRSPYYTGGWVVAAPPAAIVRIDRPHAYVHYRPQGWAGRPRPVAAQPAPQHWGGAPAPYRGQPVAPAPRRTYQAAPPPRPAPPPARPAPTAPRRADPHRHDGWHGR